MAKHACSVQQFRPLLTKRGLLLLSLLFVGPLFGLLGRASFTAALALSSATLLLLTLLFIVAQLRLYRLVRRLSATIKLPAVLPVTSTCKVEVKLSHPKNPRAKRVYFVFAPSLQQQFTPTPAAVTLSSTGVTTLHVQLTVLRRGTFAIDKAWLRLTGELEFCALQCAINLEHGANFDVVPNPRLYELQLGGSATAPLAGAFKQEQSGGEGKEFDRLRKYSSGDDLRRVDWKRSSTRGSLLVKVYRPETLQRIAVLLDCSRRMGGEIDKRLQLDYAVDAAACLVERAYANRDQVGFMAFNHRPLMQLASGRSHAHQQLIWNFLREAQPGELEADYDIVRSWAERTKRRTLLVLITSLNSPASVENIRQALLAVRYKHLSLVAAISDRDLGDLLNAPADSTADAYTVAAGYEQQQAIHSRLNVLRRSGIDCVYGDAKALPALATRRYQELKVQGKL